MAKHDNGCWYNLPNGEAATELEVTIPVKGRVLLPASAAQELDQFRDRLRKDMENRRWITYGTLGEMLATCIASYERIAADALAGANSVRDDMVAMLRSVVFVLETVVSDHLNHSQKNERIRGAMAVLERHIHSLREEAFNFHESCWRRERDLFRWSEPERRLRQRISELEEQLKAAAQPVGPEAEETDEGDVYPAPDMDVVEIARRQATVDRGGTIDEILDRLGETERECSVAYAGLGFFCEPLKEE